MEATPLAHPVNSALPAAGDGIVVALRSADFGSAASLPAVPCPARGSGSNSKPTDGPVTVKLPARRWRLPAAPGPYLADALETRWRSYRKQLRQCQESFSEEGVHELRVATRRLLAQFVLLGEVAPSTSLEKARQSLKRRLAELGDLRDTQVQLRFLGQNASRFPEAAPLRLWLERRERRLIKAAVGKVRGFRTKKLEKRLSAVVAELTARQRGSRRQKRLVEAVLRATSGAFGEAVKRRKAIDISDMRTVHQTRIAFKRFRYIVESLSPGLTGLSKRQLRALAYYQRRMGIIQDLEVIQRGVAQYGLEHKGTEPALCLFSRHLRRRRARALQAFLKTADSIFAFWPPARLATEGHAHNAGRAAQVLPERERC